MSIFNKSIIHTSLSQEKLWLKNSSIDDSQSTFLAKLLFYSTESVVMYLLEVANEFTERIQEIAFGLSIIISGLFLLEYKRYTEEQERKEMIDSFLNDNS